MWSSRPMQSGSPVLSTAVGGLQDVVGAFDPDRLVAPDPASIAAGIRAATLQPDLLPDRIACRTYAATFAWERVVVDVEQVFRDVGESG